MNVFYLDKDPQVCAEMHCDKHVVKMIIEYAQLLSTAHRVLDGEPYIDSTGARRIQRYRLHDSREDVLYKATHVNHPSAVWARQNHNNYLWLNKLFHALCDEYKHRYGRVHATADKLYGVLNTPPKNIPNGFFNEPPQAMPMRCKMDRVIDAYRNYYIIEKASFCKWTNRMTPEWFNYAHV